MAALRRLTLFILPAIAACNAIVGFPELERVGAIDDGAGVDARADGDKVTSEGGAPDAPEASTPSGPCDLSKPFDAPKPVDGPVNSGARDSSATLTGDELTIVFSRSVDLNPGTLLMAKRATRTEPFGTPDDFTAATQPLGLEGVGTPSMTHDGLVLFFYGETAAEANIFKASRSTTSAPFGTLGSVTVVNSTAVEVYPSVMPKGEELWFTSERLGGITRHLFRSVLGAQGLYQKPEVVAELKSAKNEAGVAFSADGLTIYFGSERPGGSGESDIWTATRPNLGAPFGAATVVPGINSPVDEFPSWLSPDGCRLYFSSERAGVEDIFVASRDP
jgi:hypothetical protein